MRLPGRRRRRAESADPGTGPATGTGTGPRVPEQRVEPEGGEPAGPPVDGRPVPDPHVPQQRSAGPGPDQERTGTGADPGDREATGGSPVDDEPTVVIPREHLTQRRGRRRWRRRWLAWRRWVVSVLLLGVVVAAGWLVFFSPVLAVSGVQVVGTHLLGAGTVRATAAVPTGTPLATADLGSVGARVRRLPAVKSVDVTRSWPDRVRIAVTERQAVAVVEAGARIGGTEGTDGGGMRGVDADGVVFRSYATRPAGLPVIRMGRRTDTAALREAATVAGAMRPALAAKVAYVSVRTVDSITLRLRDGHDVAWGSARESVAKAEVLAVLLGRHATSYDVRVPGQPIIRP